MINMLETEVQSDFDTLMRQTADLLAIYDAFLQTVPDPAVRGLRFTSTPSTRVLGADSSGLERVIQAHAIYFHLLNVAEEQHLAQRRERGGSQTWSMGETVRRLRQSGATAEQIGRFLRRFEIQPVLTAHPTESKRVTVLESHRRIYGALQDLARAGGDEERQVARVQLRGSLELLWQTGDIYLEKPRVVDEVDNGLFYFRHSFYPLVPRVVSELYEQLGENYPGANFDIPPLLRFSSWRGGDRDGNPFVTAEVTRQTLRRHARFIVDCYLDEMRTLVPIFSASARRAQVSEELEASLRVDAETVPGWPALLQRNPHEPYRQKLAAMIRRLEARRDALTSETPRERWPAHAYRQAAELANDLGVVRRSLEQGGAPTAAAAWLRPLEIRVKAFGFHLAKVDLRQNSETLENAMDELRRVAVGSPYRGLSESERREWLLAEIAGRRPLVAPWHAYSPATQEVLETFRLVPWALAEIDPRSLGSFIVSMTREVSDLLMVYLLLKEGGGFADDLCRLSVVPLFETIDDLRRAPRTTAELFACEPVRKRLAAPGAVQQVMIGYSDSNKDGGLVAAAWELHSAQDRLVRAAEQAGQALKFFHGTGGSISRGAGPTDRTLFALPAGTLTGRIKITEQGETISLKYANPDTALHNLRRLVGSVMAASLENELGRVRAPQEFHDEMAQIATEAEAAYRVLVDDAGFVDYFLATTPVDFIGELNLGSRPAKRKATKGVADLRAIPWVFAWTQNRHGISGWYGAGTALRAALADPKRAVRVRRMAGEWRFFNNLLRSLAAGVLTADMEVAAWYAELCPARDVRDRVFGRIQGEHGAAQAVLRDLAAPAPLESLVPGFAAAAQLRFPVIREMNRLQVQLLQRVRAGTATEQDQRHLLLTINCIAAGLRNTG